MQYNFLLLSSGIVILIYSIIIHEISHGYAAYYYGDPTAKNMGRLSLNPIPHIDPVGSIVIPVILVLMRAPFLFGWARPVPVNPYNFRNRRTAEIVVSLAGPLSNLVLVLIFLGITKIVTLFTTTTNLALEILVYGMIINFVLAFFNLMPVPPLDGSHIIRNVFGGAVEDFYRQIEPFGFLILIGLIYFGIFRSILFFFLRYFYALLEIIL